MLGAAGMLREMEGASARLGSEGVWTTTWDEAELSSAIST
jgi:hypothetical protein